MEYYVVDISAWQTDVDWHALINADIKGVIIKLGESTSLDEMFLEHVNNAVAYGLQYGVYYYGHAKTIDEARREAYQVDQWLKTYLREETQPLRGKTPPLGIWYDAEAESMLNGPQNVVYPIANFISTLREAGYTYVGLYSSYNWLTNKIDLQPLPLDVPIWTAQYYDTNSFKKEHPERICKIWQFTSGWQIGNMTLDCNHYYE